jgi:hypothetical protein
MKKIIHNQVLEESAYFCDVHPNKQCYSRIETISWYGSNYDMMKIELHLCDECLEEFYKHMKVKYNVEPKEVDLL